MVAHDPENVDLDAYTQLTVIEALLESLTEPALIASAGGPQQNAVVMFANGPAEDFFACSFDRIVGKPITDFFQQNRRPSSRLTEGTRKDDLGNWGVAPLFDTHGTCRYQVLIRLETTPTHRRHR